MFDADIQQCNRQIGTAGELYDQIQMRNEIDEHDARIYAAEIVLMLERLRQEKVSLLAFISCRIHRGYQVLTVQTSHLPIT